MFEHLRLQLDKQPTVQGITMIDVMAFPDPLGAVLRSIVRARTYTVSTLAADLSLSLAETHDLAEMMVDKGLLTATLEDGNGEVTYRVHLVHPRRQQLPANLLELLEDD